MTERLRCFIIMPYSQASDSLYREAIIPALKNLVSHDVLVLRPDDMGPVAITLKAHVEDAVRSADFCIADISRSNLNVMYEVGYAGGANKPIIFVADKEVKDFPANISSVSTLVYDRHQLDPFRQALSKACQHVIEQIEAQSAANDSIQKLAGVSISQWGEPRYLQRFVASLQGGFSASLRSPESLLRLIVPRLRQISHPEFMVRLVCGNPEGEFTSLQARELGLDPVRYRAGLRRSLRKLTKELQNMAGGNYELRITNNAIYNSVYLSEDVGILVPHLEGASTRQSVSIQIERKDNPQMFALLQQQFGQAWAGGVPSSPDVIRDIMEYAGTSEKTARELLRRLSRLQKRSKRKKKRELKIATDAQRG